MGCSAVADADAGCQINWEIRRGAAGPRQECHREGGDRRDLSLEMFEPQIVLRYN